MASKTLTAELTAELISRGEFFNGGDAAGIAVDWLDRGFSLSDASEWMDVGFWDAAAAGICRDAGYSPSQCKIIADRQTDAGKVYASGDLIYAICNSDASIEDFSR